MHIDLCFILLNCKIMVGGNFYNVKREISPPCNWHYRNSSTIVLLFMCGNWSWTKPCISCDFFVSCRNQTQAMLEHNLSSLIAKQRRLLTEESVLLTLLKEVRNEMHKLQVHLPFLITRFLLA